MVHRLALFLGGVGAAAVLALAMGMGGLLSAAPIAADTGSVTNGANQPVAAAPDTVKTIVDKVYVEPTPDPAVVHVNRPPRNEAPATTVRQPPAGEREREQERGERGDRGEHGDD